MSGSPSASVLTTPAPLVSKEQAEALAREHFGLKVTASPLIGERDSNFHLVSANGDYLLKLVNPAENPVVTDFQTGALLHIAAQAPDLPVPRVVRSLAGEAYFMLTTPMQPARLVRMLTYLPGTPLAKVARSARQRHRLGAGLARLDLALAGFEHAGSGHELLWDLSHAAKLRPLLVHIEDATRRALVARLLDRLEENVLPLFPRLRAQVIHNDFNPSNILVGPEPDGSMTRLAGIIDFGDMVKAPLVNEVAVGASYHVAEEGLFLEPLKEFVGGYHRVLVLDEREIECLFDLILARMMLTAIISSWRSTLEPHNREYILRNAGRAWTGLVRAQHLSPAQAADEFHHHLRKERSA